MKCLIVMSSRRRCEVDHTGFCGGSDSRENRAMNKKPSKFSPEVRERAIRLVREQPGEHPSMWAAAESIAPMISSTPQTRLDWVKREEVDRGERDGVSTDERECIKALEPKSRNCAVPTRSSSWRVRFSPRWRSTADSSPEGLRRSASRHLWGRADLQGFADCDVGLLTPCCAASRSVQTLRPRQTR